MARAAIPKGSIYILTHDEPGRLFADADFAALFPACGQPAFDPAQLALVTLMPFAEGPTDRQAADAVRGRIDWKYALCLELADPGFHYSILCDFRARLLAGGVEGLLFETPLVRCREAGLPGARGRQRADSTLVLGAVRALNRLELAGDILAHHTLAAAAPDRLRSRLPSEWAGRYGRRLDEYRLPREAATSRELAEAIGADRGEVARDALLRRRAPLAARSLLPRRCAGSDCSTTMRRTRPECSAGEEKPTRRPPRCVALRLTIPTCARAASARPPGWATSST